MKNYSSKRAKKGKLAYRTPSRFIYEAVKESLKRKFPNNWGKIKDRFYCIILAMIGYEIGFYLVEGGIIMSLYGFLYPLLAILDIYWFADIFKVYRKILYLNLTLAIIAAYLTTKDSKNFLERILVGIAVLYLITGAGVYIIGI